MSDEVTVVGGQCRSAFTGHSFAASDELLMDAGQLDTHEFDRYLNKSQHDLDSNHNYQHQIQQQQMHAFYQQQQQAAPPEQKAEFGADKTDDDFSLILADVRKTCYNSS